MIEPPHVEEVRSIDNQPCQRRHTFATIEGHDVTMLDIEMVRAPLFALVRATGSLHTADEVETLTTALEFVPKDDDLVLDLSGLSSMSPSCVPDLTAVFRGRENWSKSAVVSHDPGVTSQLIIGEVDHVVPVLSTLMHATDVMLARRSIHTVEAGG